MMKPLRAQSQLTPSFKTDETLVVAPYNLKPSKLEFEWQKLFKEYHYPQMLLVSNSCKNTKPFQENVILNQKGTCYMGKKNEMKTFS